MLVEDSYGCAVSVSARETVLFCFQFDLLSVQSSMLFTLYQWRKEKKVGSWCNICPLLLCMLTLFIPQTQNARHETKMTMLTLVYRSAIMRSIFNNWVTEKLLWVYFFIPLLLTMKRAYGEHYFAPLLLIDVDIFCIPFAIFHTTNCRHIF